jgi:hypothetical protein
VPLDPFWQKVAEVGRLSNLIDRLNARPDLMSGAAFKNLLDNAPKDLAAARDFVGTLNNVMASVEKLKTHGHDVPNIGRLLEGLGSTDPNRRSTALFLLEGAAKVPTPKTGPVAADTALAADAILGKFDFADVKAIRDLHPNVEDVAVFNSLAAVARDIDADAPTILSLVAEAGRVDPQGRATPDFLRLNAILESMGPGPHTATDVRAGIKYQNDLAAQLANVSGDLVHAVLKESGLVPVTGKVLELSKVPEFQTNGKVSGSKVNKFFRKPVRVDAVVRTIVDGTGKIDEAQWLKLQDTLRNTDVDPITMSGIIGFYWEQIRLKSLEAQNGSGKVFDQVNITIKDATEQPRIDAVIVKSVDKDANVVRIEMEEDKTGRAVLSDAQQALFDRATKTLGKENPDIKVDLPPEILSQLSDPSKVTVIIDRIEVVRAPSKLSK